MSKEKLVDIIRAEYLRVYPTGNPIPFIDLARAILAAGFQYVSLDQVVVPKQLWEGATIGEYKAPMVAKILAARDSPSVLAPMNRMEFLNWLDGLSASQKKP